MKKVNQVKTKAALKKRIKQLEERYNKEIHANLVECVNYYLQNNKALNDNDVFSKPFESFTDSVCLSGAWMADRLRNYVGLTHHQTYKKTLSKKIRKALGYTF